MEKYKEKIRLLFVPLLIIALCFNIVYSFLHWLLFIKGGLSLKEEVLNFALPITLPLIPMLIWLRPKARRLVFKNDNASFFYQILATLIIAIPTIIAQEYLKTATGKLTRLEVVSDMDKQEPTKYYTLSKLFIDKSKVALQTDFSVSGKYNTEFNMKIYTVTPILDTDTGMIRNSKYLCWLGKKYSKTISNSKTEDEKKEAYEEFARDCEREYNNSNLQQFVYLELMDNSNDRNHFLAATKNESVFEPKKHLVFAAFNEPFAQRNGQKLQWIFGSLAIGLFTWAVLLWFPPLTTEKQAKKKNPDELKEFVSFFIPQKHNAATAVIADINILVFIIMVLCGLGFISFSPSALLQWGGNLRSSVADGEWWRLITSMFLHGGFMHILTNMFALILVGLFLEPLLGKTKFVLVYFLTGLIASLTSIAWHNNDVVSVGASGAIFGLYGFMLVAILMKVFPRSLGSGFLISILVFVGFNLVMGFVGSGIDNAAHLGGLVSGLFLGAGFVLTGLVKPEDEEG